MLGWLLNESDVLRFGEDVLMPLSRSIRIYIEGEIYPPTPYDPYSRWIIPKPWHLPLEDILIFTMLTVIISLIEVIVIRRVIAVRPLFFFFFFFFFFFLI